MPQSIVKMSNSVAFFLPIPVGSFYAFPKVAAPVLCIVISYPEPVAQII